MNDRSPALRAVNRTGAILVRLEDILAWLAAAALLGTAIIVFGDVFMRYVFARPLQWSRDLIVLYLVPAMVFLLMPTVFRERAHISVDLIMNLASGAVRRFVGIFSSAMMLVFVWIMAQFALTEAVHGYQAGQYLPGSVPMPTWVPHFFVNVGFFVCGLRLLVQLAQLLLGEEPAATSSHGAEAELAAASVAEVRN